VYPKPFLEYLIYFHAERDYFECHEVLEEYWKEQHLQEKHWVALIQLAVGLYHHRRGNFVGALKMLKSSLKQIKKDEITFQKLHIQTEKLIPLMESRIKKVESKTEYTDFNIPLAPELEEQCKGICYANKQTWNATSPFDNQFLIHKHTLRNREDVIKEREYQKKQKQQKRGGS